MPKILIIQQIHEDGIALLEARGDISYDVVDGSSMDEVAQKIVDADGVTIRTALLPGDVLERAERLKVVSRHGVGYDNVDLDHLNSRGIPLALTADANASSVAEHVMFMILHLAKRGFRYDRATRTGDWALRNSLEVVDIGGRHVLILGFGRIGRQVATLCQTFAMKVSVFDPFLSADVIQAAGCQPVGDFRSVLGETDVLTVHMPLSDETRHMIGDAEFSALPDHAFVINCARGGIVDEPALKRALTSGGIAGAGIDVFEQEPPAHDHPLFALENVIFSPHSAGLTLECAKRMAVLTVRNVLAGIDGTLDPMMVVNRNVL